MRMRDWLVIVHARCVVDSARAHYTNVIPTVRRDISLWKYDLI